MTRAVPYSLAIVGLFLAASLSLGLTDQNPDAKLCEIQPTCQSCVQTQINKTEGNNVTHCIYSSTASGYECSSTFKQGEGVSAMFFDLASCLHIPTPSPVEPNTTTTTTVAPSTNATTTQPTTTSTTPPPSTTNSTTTTVPTTTPPPPNSTTTAAPTTSTLSPNTTTTTEPPPKPTPAPSKGGFSGASFIGGIVFAAALSSLAYLIWRFYKVRLDRNYHTFSNPTF